MRLSFEEIRAILVQILEKNGFEPESADILAVTFTESNRDGYASHGLNRFPLFIRGVKRGYVKPDKIGIRRESFGSFEKWDGQLAAGILNARTCMERAIRLASESGIGCIALRNTNHWMRGGSYGWQAVEAGYGTLCWTNTLPNMPPWGSVEQRTGNNPIVLALPGSAEMPLVLDMALSQFSYGKLDQAERNGEELVYPGGFDRAGALSVDPREILASGRLLPVGLWKGSALSLMLDLFAALLSGGQATMHIGRQAHEYGLSQLFIAFDVRRIGGPAPCDDLIREIVGFYKNNDPDVYFPGEQTLIRRRESLEKGIPVDPDYWAEIQALL